MNFKLLRNEIISGNTSVKEIVNDYFSKIEEINPKINAYICTTKDLAHSQAYKIDKLIQNEEQLPPLAGLPIAIKDNICTKGVVTSCSSKMLKNFVAPYESTASSKLWSSGGICLGKTNLDEFGWEVLQRRQFLELLQIPGILIESQAAVLVVALLQLLQVYVPQQ